MDESVLIAAIQYEDKIYTGARHLNIIAKLWFEYKRYPRGRKEGFLTNTGRFVDRKEAARIAFLSGQTRSESDILYSEDIY